MFSDTPALGLVLNLEVRQISCADGSAPKQKACPDRRDKRHLWRFVCLHLSSGVLADISVTWSLTGWPRLYCIPAIEASSTILHNQCSLFNGHLEPSGAFLLPSSVGIPPSPSRKVPKSHPEISRRNCRSWGSNNCCITAEHWHWIIYDRFFMLTSLKCYFWNIFALIVKLTHRRGDQGVINVFTFDHRVSQKPCCEVRRCSPS